MAKGTWKTLFGLKLSRWASRDPDRRPLPEDCNTVVTRSALKAAGVKNVTRGHLKLERDPRFHRKVVIFPDGRREEATHQTSLDWIVGVQRDENRERSRANLMVGSQAPLETLVTKQQPGGAPFVAEIWLVPIATPTLRTDAPEARQPPGSSRQDQSDRPAAAVARDVRELDSALLDVLCSDARRLLNAPDAPSRRSDLAAELGLEHSKEDRLAFAKVLYRLRAEGYHVAP